MTGAAGRFVADQLRRDSPSVAGERAVRPREGRVHRGACKQRVGKFELPSGGTLFLDEIGDMPLALQAKLLRVLQERQIERSGRMPGDTGGRAGVCATNRIWRSVDCGAGFREDLYFRLSVAPMTCRHCANGRGRRVAGRLPAASFRANWAAGRGLSTGGREAAGGHAWPGNVRELEGRVKTAVLVADEPLVTALDLGLMAP